MIIPTYVRHSSSACNMFCAELAMFVAERVLLKKQPVGVPAHRGTAVEDGVTFGLLNPEASLLECVDVAQLKYDSLTALSGDERREKYRDTMTEMVSMALSELRPYGIPSATQGWVEWKPDGLKLPFVGIFDFHWADHNITTDLKTTEKMPSAVKINHAKQVALYVTSNNASPRVTYTTPRKCLTYNIDNIDAHRAALYQVARRIEKFLSLSDDPDFFVSITAPDLDAFYWTPPAARQMAFEVWGI